MFGFAHRMAHGSARWPIAALLFTLAACGSGGGGGGGGDGGGGAEPNSVTLGGTTYTDGAADVAVGGSFSATGFPINAGLFAEQVTGGVLLNRVTLSLYNDASSVVAPGDYALEMSQMPGTAWLEVYSLPNNINCGVNGGTLSVTAFGAVGERIVGSFSVSGWIDFSGGAEGAVCPDVPTAGTFSVARAADSMFGNDGAGTDTFGITAFFGEDEFPFSTGEGSTLYDPLIWVRYSAVSNKTTLSVSTGASTALNGYTRTFLIRFDGAPADATDFPATYLETFDGGALSCFSSGTVSVTTAGAVGGLMEGTLDFGAFGDEACPDGILGGFSITRE